MNLRRSLYGLSQLPALWYDTIGAALLGIGVTPQSCDPCVYTLGSEENIARHSLYVDNISISGGNLGVIQRLKNALMGRFA